VFRVLRPVRIHRAAIRHLDADRPLRQHGSARHHPHCSSLGAARRCPPGSPLFAPSDRHGATGRCVPTIASVPRALGRTESIAGQQHQRPGWRTAPMPGTAQPRTIRTGPPTWCHRPQQLQRPAAQRIQNLTPVRRRHADGEDLRSTVRCARTPRCDPRVLRIAKAGWNVSHVGTLNQFGMGSAVRRCPR
jgi:hypothetical protein